MSDGPLRAALAACGGIAELSLGAASSSDDFEIVAIQDPDPAALRRAGDRFGIDRRHAAFEALLGEDIDFVIVSSPNHLHAEQVLEAVAAGKPCLVQKPMAPTLAEAEGMVAAAEAAGVKLGVLMFELGKPLNRQLAAMVEGGWLGEPTLVQACAAHGIYLRDPPSRGDWRRDPRKVGGGAFIQLALHHVDLAAYILGRAVRAVAVERTRGLTVFEDETTLATLRFEGGVIGSFTASFATDLWSFTLAGTRGRVQITDAHVVVRGEEPFDGEIFSYDAPGREIVISKAALEQGREAAGDACEIHAAFARWVRGEGDFPATGARGLADMRVVDAADRAIREGRCIFIG
jgi:predicted dehydrogenase